MFESEIPAIINTEPIVINGMTKSIYGYIQTQLSLEKK